MFQNLSSQAYTSVFSANFAAYCVKKLTGRLRSRQDSAREQRSVALGWIATDSPPAHFCLVCNKIMLENPHTFLMKTGSKNRGCCKNLCDTVYSYKLYLNGQTCIPRLCYNKDSSRLQATSRKPEKRSMNCNSFLMFTMTVEKA